MKIAELARIAWFAGLFGLLSAPGLSQAQAPSPAQAPATLDAINTEYERELAQVERHRLERIGRLAQSQPRGQAEATLDAYFRLAIAKNLYADAEPMAKQVIRAGESGSILWLAYLVEIVGLADKGAYDDSLASLSRALKLKGTQPGGAIKEASLPVETRASIVDAYFQRLVHADQIDAARKAMKMIVETSEVPAIRDLAARRLKQVDLVGKPSPALSGTDLDGKSFSLEASKGDVVLVVFWATWCLPNAREMPWLDYLDRTYRPRGLRIVGVNLDNAQAPGKPVDSLMPNIHRFLLDYNVTWTTLLNGTGPQDHASAFGVTEIPASVLIGRDGKVSHIDLTGRQLEKAIVSSLGAPK